MVHRGERVAGYKRSPINKCNMEIQATANGPPERRCEGRQWNTGDNKWGGTGTGIIDYIPGVVL